MTNFKMRYFKPTSMVLVVVVQTLIFLGVFTQQSLVIGKAEEEQRIKELLEWEAPLEMREAYPYYLLGKDKAGNPVWLAPFGRWDLRWMSEGGKEFEPLYKKYAEQMVQRFYHSAINVTHSNSNQVDNNSSQASNTDDQSGSGENQSQELGQEQSVEGYIVINDLDGYSHRQYLHPPAIKKILEAFQLMFNAEMTYKGGSKTIFCVNVNFAARSMWTVVESILGEFGSKFELYGTNVNKWKHALLRQIPPETLPEYMGGIKGFKPITDFGKK